MPDFARSGEHQVIRPPAERLGQLETLQKQGFDPIGTGPDEFGPFLRNEITRWPEVARAAGVKS